MAFCKDFGSVTSFWKECSAATNSKFHYPVSSHLSQHLFNHKRCCFGYHTNGSQFQLRHPCQESRNFHDCSHGQQHLGTETATLFLLMEMNPTEERQIMAKASTMLPGANCISCCENQSYVMRLALHFHLGINLIWWEEWHNFWVFQHVKISAVIWLNRVDILAI